MNVNPHLKPTDLDGANIISDSQATAWLTCERKWMFSYVFEKTSATRSRALNLGIIVHDMLEVFFLSIQAGADKAEARLTTMLRLTHLFETEGHSADILTTAYMLVDRYINQDTIHSNSRILEVETDFFLPINNEYWYGLRLDLLVEAQVGRQKGKILLIDHKTTYDFWQPNDLLLLPQMPKYVMAVRFSGYPVHEAYINQIRTRFDSNKIPDKSNEDLFKRSPVGITDERTASALSHQMVASERIMSMRNKPLPLIEAECLPVQNKMVCKNCPFMDPCIKMEDGYSATGALGENYIAKTSGFDRVTNGGSKEATGPELPDVRPNSGTF